MCTPGGELDFGVAHVVREIQRGVAHLFIDIDLFTAVEQAVPAGFELFDKASAYSRGIGPVYVRQDGDDVSLVQPTSLHMCNSGGALHGGYMMSFADTAITRAALR